MNVTVTRESWPMKEAFSIAGYTFTHYHVLVVEVAGDGVRGRGETSGVYYRGETPEVMIAQIEQVRGRIESGISREELREALPPGGARCALDAALWDLEAKRTGVPAHRRAGVVDPRPLATTYTIGADSPARMACVARSYAPSPRLKLKLTGEGDVPRLRAVRAERPEAWISVDANRALTRSSLEALLPVLEELDIRLIEQPLPVGREGDLMGLGSPIPLAADESVQSVGDLASMQGIFNVVNIKLDKCGGLTEALEMVREVRRLGMTPMVGCMLATTMGIAPAFLLGQRCEYVDLDMPLFLVRDREPSATYRDGIVDCPKDWGYPQPAEVPDESMLGPRLSPLRR